MLGNPSLSRKSSHKAPHYSCRFRSADLHPVASLPLQLWSVPVRVEAVALRCQCLPLIIETLLPVRHYSKDITYTYFFFFSSLVHGRG